MKPKLRNSSYPHYFGKLMPYKPGILTRGDRLSGEFQKEISAVISNKLKNVYPELSTIISVTSADIADARNFERLTYFALAKIHLVIFGRKHTFQSRLG